MTIWIVPCRSVKMKDMLGVISERGGGIVEIGGGGGNDGGRW